MCLKSFLSLLILIFYLTPGAGQNQNDSELELFVRNKPILIAKQQSFKISLADSWLGKDKADHFLVSAFLAAGSYYFLRKEQNMTHKNSIMLSVGFTFSIGVAKEIRDGFLKGRFASVKDGIADILGIGAGVLLFNLE